MSLIKESGFSDIVGQAAKVGKTVGPALATGGITAYALKQLLDKIKNDIRRKRIIEDIALNDPLLKTVDKQTLMRWYATINYYAPTLALNKLTVTEVLQNFAKFGKVDFNTVKMLIDTEKNIAETRKANTNVVKDIVSSVTSVFR